MGMILAALICVPVLLAILIGIAGNGRAHGILVYLGAAIVIALSIGSVILWFAAGAAPMEVEMPYASAFDKVTLLGDVLIMCVIVWQSWKYRKYPIGLLSILQTAIILGVEFLGPEHEEFAAFRYDELTVIMVLIIGIIGTLIGVYAVGYMKGYHEHHAEVKDRRVSFMAVCFLFYGAMFGLVATQNVMWMEMFWETTSLCSFLMIGYTKTDEAITNCFRALWMNLVGGFGFAVVILLGSSVFGTQNLFELIYQGQGISRGLWELALCALVFAALTKTSQFPFSGWLLGAMVAPTPSSALLHSATMVKAGVYLVLRLAPMLADSQFAGMMAVFVGGFTFFSTSVLAIMVSDAKRVLAYSTISNLGLMVACAGIGTSATIWAAIYLMIFHAVSKSMCFQAVGAIENSSHSRDIEDMDGMISRYPLLGIVLLIGMIGMFLAPFGMLISKWAALKSVLDSHEMLLLLFIVFGSATTMLYWTKWMSKLFGHREETHPDKTKKDEALSMVIHAVLAMGLCFSIPFLSNHLIMPFLTDTMSPLGEAAVSGIVQGNFPLVIIMVSAMFLIPGAGLLVSKRMRGRSVEAYMSGITLPGSEAFVDASGGELRSHVSSWYLENTLQESTVFRVSALLALAAIVILFALAGGGAV